MDVGSATQQQFETVPFYVGHHEQSRKELVTEEIFHHAEDLGYDFLTVPITNEAHRRRILDEFSKHQSEKHISHEDAQNLYSEISSLKTGETEVSPGEVSSRLLYFVSDWIELASPEPYIADLAKQVLLQEITYAGFCGATNIVLHGPKPGSQRNRIANFASAVRQAQAASPSVNISILLPPIFGPTDQDENSFHKGINGSITDGDVNESRVPQPDALSSWDMWHLIRAACHYDNRVNVALTIPKRLPPNFVLDRWLSEPIRIIHLPATSFTPNKMNVDVLTPAHQSFLSRSLRGKVSPWILLSGIGPLPGLDDEADGDFEANLNGFSERPCASEIGFAQLSPQQTSPHLMYLREHLQRRQPARSALEKYGAGYQDWPQSPLQPLADNLDSMTYEVFEKDPVKYAWYECAVRSALEDLRAEGWPRAGNGGKAVVVAVVGAGRGPLMQRVLQASAATGIEVDAWALEKNPSAFVHLQKRNISEWSNRVHLVQSDMRSWTGPKAAHGERVGINILVSELLGSLGDNELSPECLEGVQHLLHPTHGISIPSIYTAFATPVAAQELWRTIKYRASPATTSGKIEDPLSLPYVSWLHSFDYLSSMQPETSKDSRPVVEDLWSFHHPIPQHHLDSPAGKSNHHNIRTAHRTFRIPHRGVCHGIAGYFEAVLYDRSSTLARFSLSTTSNAQPSSTRPTTLPPPVHPWPSDPSHVVLSTNPLTMPTASPNMISWFPLFFPFKTPFYVPDNGEFELGIWRKTDGRGVWYEWCAEVFGPDGEKVGESGWCSSEAAPCLL